MSRKTSGREIKWSLIQKPFFNQAYVVNSRGKAQAVLRTRRQACLLLSAPKFMKASTKALELLADMSEHKDKQAVMEEITAAIRLYRRICMRNSGTIHE